MELTDGLEGFVLVVLRVVSVGNRRRIVGAARREVVGWNLAGNRVVQMPAIRPNPARAHSDDGGQCQRER